MSGEVQFELTAQDHVDAVHAHTGRIFGKVSWALLFVALQFPLVDLWAGMSIIEDMAFWIFFGLALIFLAWNWVARDWSVRRAFREGDAMRSAIRINWDEQAIRFDTDTSKSEYGWDRFFRWRTSKKSLLLYRDSQFFIVIPRRILPKSACEEMVAALKAAGVTQR